LGPRRVDDGEGRTHRVKGCEGCACDRQRERAQLFGHVAVRGQTRAAVGSSSNRSNASWVVSGQRSKPAEAGLALAARVSRARRKSGGKRQKRDRRSRAPPTEATPAKAAPLEPPRRDRGRERRRSIGFAPSADRRGGLAADDGRRKSGPQGCTGWFEPKPPRANSPRRSKAAQEQRELAPPADEKPTGKRKMPSAAPQAPGGGPRGRKVVGDAGRGDSIGQVEL